MTPREALKVLVEGCRFEEGPSAQDVDEAERVLDDLISEVEADHGGPFLLDRATALGRPEGHPEGPPEPPARINSDGRFEPRPRKKG